MNIRLFFSVADGGMKLLSEVEYGDDERNKYHNLGLSNIHPGVYEIRDQGGVYCLCLLAKELCTRWEGRNHSFDGGGWEGFIRSNPEFARYFPYVNKVSEFNSPDEYLSGLTELVLRTAKDSLHSVETLRSASAQGVLVDDVIDVLPQLPLRELSVGSGEGMRMLIDNKVYTISMDVNREETSMVEEAKRQMMVSMENTKTFLQGAADGYRVEAERRIADLQHRIDNRCDMPLVSIENVQDGMRICRRSNRIVFMMPAVYAPTKIKPEGSVEIFNIRDAPLCEKKMMIGFWTLGSKITEISTYTPTMKSRFSHYHQHQPDCWGEARLPDSWVSTGDFFKYARDVEKILSVINGNSLAVHHPRGLPDISEIQHDEGGINDSAWTV